MEFEDTNIPFYTYILESENTHGLYIGYTSNLERRLKQHNELDGKYTSNKGIWRVIYYKSFDNKSKAIALERQLKRWKSKKRVIEWIEREKQLKAKTESF